MCSPSAVRRPSPHVYRYAFTFGSTTCGAPNLSLYSLFHFCNFGARFWGFAVANVALACVEGSRWPRVHRTVPNYVHWESHVSSCTDSCIRACRVAVLEKLSLRRMQLTGTLEANCQGLRYVHVIDPCTWSLLMWPCQTIHNGPYFIRCELCWYGNASFGHPQPLYQLWAAHWATH